MLKKILLSTAILFSLTLNLNAEPLKLSENGSPQALSVIKTLFSEYLADKVGTNIVFNTIDLNDDNIGEIIAKFVNSKTCEADFKECRTVVLKFNSQSNKWEIILDKPSTNIEFIKADGIDGRNFNSVKLDDVTWNWDNKKNKFNPIISNSPNFKAIDFTKAPPESKDKLAVAFGPKIQDLSKIQEVNFEFSQQNLDNKNNSYVIIKMSGTSLCGSETGCPLKILHKTDKGWENIFNGSTIDNVYISNISRAGMKDIIVHVKNGYLQMGWDGTKYILADNISSINKLN